jgi:putative membrane protein
MRVLLALACSMLLPVAASAKGRASDRRFIDRAYSINEGEIELGKLAQQKGTTPQVREYGQRMVADHRVALDQLRDVAEKDNLKLPNQLQAAEVDLYKSLAKLDGKQFDDAYIDHMVVGHKSAIQLFEEEADRGKNPDVRAYADKELPMLRAHEEISRRDLQQL